MDIGEIDQRPQLGRYWAYKAVIIHPQLPKGDHISKDCWQIAGELVVMLFVP
jgi:hypothetical protein